MLRIILIIIFLGLILSCRQEKKISIVFGGDVMLDRGIRKEIEKKGLPYLTDNLSPVFRQADFTIVNLECPATEINAPETKRFVFRAEPRWLKTLKESGVTHCIVANNHSYDHGRAGLISTAENLVKNDLIPVGYGTTQRKACEPVFLEKNGIKIALFSSVTLPLEAWMYLEETPGMCQASIDDLVTAIATLKKKSPETHVVVSLHWGLEYQMYPTPIQQSQARQLVEAGADAIIGHHPHVIQSYESINSKPVFYSIGNLIFDNPDPKTHQGILVKLNFGEKNEVEIIPYRCDSWKPVLLNDAEKEMLFQRLRRISDPLP
jgi:poly-gamma-glutamate capsule biosynthesis protein CapA/YwtB (metallophosphatase superfamily)